MSGDQRQPSVAAVAAAINGCRQQRRASPELHGDLNSSLNHDNCSMDRHHWRQINSMKRPRVAPPTRGHQRSSDQEHRRPHHYNSRPATSNAISHMLPSDETSGSPAPTTSSLGRHSRRHIGSPARTSPDLCGRQHDNQTASTTSVAQHHYEPPGLMFNSYSSSLHGQYSSSQAHLQSLVSSSSSSSSSTSSSASLSNNNDNNNLLTTSSQRQLSSSSNFLQRKQTTPKFNKQTFPQNGSIGRETARAEQQQAPRLDHQYRSHSSQLAAPATTKPMRTTTSSSSIANNQPLLSTATVGHNSSTTIRQPHHQQQRPNPIGATVMSTLPGGPIGSSTTPTVLPPPYTSAARSDPERALPPAAPGGCQQVTAPTGQVFSLGVQSSGHRRVLNFMNVAPSSTLPPNQHQQPPSASSTTSAPFNLQQYPLLHQAFNTNSQPAIVSDDPQVPESLLRPRPSHQYTKSKSCLTCADISIKWYIVVIALLGLICALIGTIVGAVHSAGRDYISLALLLLGVGLVLIAISWIALRITINTYKTNRSPSAVTGGSGGGGGSSSSLAAGQPLAPSPTSPLQPTASQLFRANHQRHLSASQSALITDRLYLMAAAAAALTRQQQHQHQQRVALVGSSGSPTNGQPADSAGRLMSSIKRRLPRRLARLISPGGPSGGSSAPTAEPDQAQHTPQPPPPPPPQTALVALLHHYNQLLPPHHHHLQQQFHNGQLHQHGFLFPAPLLAPPPPMGHPFGLAHHLHDPQFRPPPPSYSASMQDQRLRMIMQERAALQQLQQQQHQQNHQAQQSSQANVSSQATLADAAAAAAEQPPSSSESPVDPDAVSLSETSPDGHQIQASSSNLNQVEVNSSTSTKESADSSRLAGAKVGASARNDSPPGKLKASLSVPSALSTLVTTQNDLYVPLGDSTRQTPAVSKRPRQESSSSISVMELTKSFDSTGPSGSSHTVVNVNCTGRQEHEEATRRPASKVAQVKILGYL